MPRILKHVDQISREKGRDVLFVIFDDEIFDDKFGNWLNRNINKIDFISQNLIAFGVGAILLSIFTNSLFAGILGVVSLSTFLIIGLFLFYNIDSYKINLKLSSYFKLTRLLSASLVGNSKIMMFFFVISASTHLSPNLSFFLL